MTTRRQALGGAAAFGALAPAGALALGEGGESPVAGFRPEPRYRPQIVAIKPGVGPGEIHIDSRFHFLYLTRDDATAIRYGCAVGAAGRAFTGEAVIGMKRKWPRWTPTAGMIERDPERYGPWAAGMPGGPENPLGARALYLFQDGRDTLYRVHGTPQPWTIGRSVSSGCIRMVNAHAVDLYERVPVGTKVVVHG